MSLAWVAVAVAFGVTSSAGGDVRLELEGSLPCSEDALLHAARLRVAVSTASADVVTVRGIDDRIEVSHRGQVRRVDVGRSTDVTAARRIALAISDLVRAPVTVGLPPIEEVGSSETATAAGTATEVEIAGDAPLPAAEEPRAPAFIVGAFLRGGGGATFERARFAAGVDASIRILDPLRAAIAVGPLFVPTARRARFTLDYAALVIGAGLGLRLPEHAWEVRALGVVETYFVRGVGIDRDVDALFGIEGSFSHAFAIGAGVEATVGLSLTGYLRRKRFTVRGEEIFATERLAAALSVGVAWGALQ